MFKVAWLARFPRGTGQEEARRHWRDVHGPLCLQVPGLQRYVQNQVLAPIGTEGVTEGTTGFDGYSCGWWPDSRSYSDAMRTPQWQDLVADGANVFDMDWLWGMSAELEEVVQKEPPAAWAGTDRGRFKVVWVVKFRADLDRAKAHDYWTNHHGPLACRIREIGETGAYVQNHAVRAIGADSMPTDEVELGFDGFSECWFEDRAAYDDAMRSPEWRDLVEDGGNLFDMQFLWLGMSAVLEERIMRP